MKVLGQPEHERCGITAFRVGGPASSRIRYQ